MKESDKLKILEGNENVVVISGEDFIEILEMFYRKKQREEDKTVFLSRIETAEFLHCDLATLWKMEQKGTLIPTRLGRRVYYRKSDVVECLERGRK